MTLLLSRQKYILGLAVSRILHIMHDVLCLLHSCGNIHYAIATVWLYLLPSELLDVALKRKGTLVLVQEWSKAWMLSG